MSRVRVRPGTHRLSRLESIFEAPRDRDNLTLPAIGTVHFDEMVSIWMKARLITCGVDGIWEWCRIAPTELAHGTPIRLVMHIVCRAQLTGLARGPTQARLPARLRLVLWAARGI